VSALNFLSRRPPLLLNAALLLGMWTSDKSCNIFFFFFFFNAFISRNNLCDMLKLHTVWHSSRGGVGIGQRDREARAPRALEATAPTNPSTGGRGGGRHTV
jgi:hypothetical protein